MHVSYMIEKRYDKFIIPLLKNESYLSTYGGMIHPISDMSSWPIIVGDNIYPPLVKRPPGKPKISKRREANKVPPQ